MNFENKLTALVQLAKKQFGPRMTEAVVISKLLAATETHPGAVKPEHLQFIEWLKARKDPNRQG